MYPTPVFDFVPPGLPPIMNSAIAEAVENATESPDGPAPWEALLDEQVRQLRTNPTYGERLRETLRESGTNLLCPTVWSVDPRVSYRDGTYRDLTRWIARFDALDWLHLTTSPADARAVVNAGNVGVVLGTQNLGEFTAGDSDRVEELYNAGLRVMQLTYNRQNHVGAGCTEPPNVGLSRHGVDVVDTLNQLGVVIDLSHCNRTTTLDAIDASDSPVAVTHSHCGALHDHYRAKSDEELEALSKGDGYLGILAYPHQYEQPTFETFFEHFEHATSILGRHRVGVATDWCITTPDVPPATRPSLASFFQSQGAGRGSKGDSLTPEQFETSFDGLSEYADRRRIRTEFERRDYTASEIDAFLGGNFLSFWERVLASP